MGSPILSYAQLDALSDDLRARVSDLEDAIRGLRLEDDECNCTEDRRCNRCRALDALHNT